jgi:predicted Rossmann-fold nucleotide-binding protein
MEVASQAAASAGGTVVGLPMRGWEHLTPNRWNHELRWSDTYPQRLAHLLAADAVIALDGGIGTLSEAAVVWAALQTEPVLIDLILLGAGWPPVMESLAAHLIIDEQDLARVAVCADPAHAIAHIRSRARSGPPGPGRAHG